MPKAIFLLDHFWGERSGGAEWQTFVLCRALREIGWEIHYLAESLTGKTGSTQELQGIVVHWLPPLQWRSRFHSSQRRLYHVVERILADLQPDILYSRGNNCFTGIGVCHRARRQRKLKTVWGAAADWEISNDFYRQVLRSSRKPLWKKALLWPDMRIKDWDHAAEIAQADCVIVQTEQQAQLVRQRFQRESVRVPSSHEIPPDPDFKSSPPVAIFVAHIGRRKRVELFVELARRCVDIPASFLIIGDFADASYEQEIRRTTVGIKNLQYHGPASAEESNRQIARATILVSTTEPGREGYPNVFIQAWLRKPLVVTLDHDPDGVIGQNPFLGRRAGNLEGLVASARLLLADPAGNKAMGDAARQWAIQHHGYESNRDRIANVFGSLIISK